MVEWSEGSAREAGAATFEVFANDDHLVRQQVFRDAGLALAEDHYTFRRYPLTGDLPAPHLPDGYRFRDMTVLDGDTLERRVDLHRVVWAPSRWTPVKHARLMETRHYRPDLDLIAVAPNGDFAVHHRLVRSGSENRRVRAGRVPPRLPAPGPHQRHHVRRTAPVERAWRGNSVREFVVLEPARQPPL
ncbi:MAG: hypothetical protein R2845_02150 [Thermomicrobiales bacterium]